MSQIFESRLASRIDAAITAVDKLVVADVLTRLVLQPARMLSVFWLVEEGRHAVYVISCPATLRLLKPGDLYDGADFLRNLAQERAVLGRLYGKAL